MRTLAASELILNEDGSIYHLNLRPEQIANTIIAVGDPDRVKEVTKHFEQIEYTVSRREFKTCTGRYKGKRISVISTGIGTDNIDIVINELDALVNVDFTKRTVKNKLTSLEIIRIGTSGSIQRDIEVNSLVVSAKAIGLDGMLHAYDSMAIRDVLLEDAFIAQTQWSSDKARPYVIDADLDLLKKFECSPFQPGFTATLNGFYGAQARTIRLPLQDETLHEKIQHFKVGQTRISNLEMETAGIYGLATLLDHRAISLNAILANRITGTFSTQPQKAVEKLIVLTLDKLVE
ncbi:nucleoside phosphorylase [Flavobacteriaceae bacterium F08102]|nr:nucleoside phosphorylase [Flavobacteriaceae bacterium F08102]